MPSIPLFGCQISTEDVVLIGKVLEQQNFTQESASSKFIKSYTGYSVEVHLSQSSDHPSIICCCSKLQTSLPKLLSFITPNSSLPINLIVMNQSSNLIDWNPLISLISMYNLSLNVVNDENDLAKKLCEIINNLAKQNIRMKSMSPNGKNGNATADNQVK